MVSDDITYLLERIKFESTKRRIFISTSESCTGGMLSSYLTHLPGSSLFFSGGVISYSNESKIKLLSVEKKTMDIYGAVSEQVAADMASGCRKAFSSNIALSITGIAGPDGGSKNKPVGTVCFGIESEYRSLQHTRYLKGSRSQIRSSCCEIALNIIITEIKQEIC